MEEEKIAQGTYNFRNMREDGYRYVDKTAVLYPLVTRGRDSFFFISRPRRFGKSLMLSTLECLFRGERDLFKGLAIDKMDYDWKSYPILHFNFAGLKVETLETFKIDFRSYVKETLTKAGCTWNEADFPGANFSRAINTLAEASEQKSVVILIDEYDAPVGHALNDIKKAEAIRQELSDFYIQIKNNVGAIRFMLMTGVTRFTQLSVFSALNTISPTSRWTSAMPRFSATPMRSWRPTSVRRCTAMPRSWGSPMKITAKNSAGGSTATVSLRIVRIKFTIPMPLGKPLAH